VPLMARIAACLMLSGVGKIGLTRAEVDHIDSLAPQFIGVRHTFHGEETSDDEMRSAIRSSW